MKTVIGPPLSKEELKRMLLMTIDDAFTGHFDPELILDDDWHDRLGDMLRELRRFWCENEGHEIVHDQCGLPDHDYCVMCEDLFPGKA